MNIKLIALNSRYSHSCPAIFYVRQEVACNIPQANLELVQCTINDPYYDTLIAITAGQADFFFFSVYIWNSDYIRRLINDLAAISPATAIILGGPQAVAFDPGELPANSTVFKGEIEGAPHEFYVDLQSGNLKSNYSGKSSNDFPSPYLEDDFARQLRNRYIYYESSRGCPFSCTYCLSSVERGVRHKAVVDVKREIRQIVAHQPRIIKLVDRTFNDRTDRALEIWRFLAELPGETIFHFEIAPDRFSDEMLEFLQTVPPDKFQFEIGVQSTNPQTLEAVQRKIKLENIQKNITRLAALDTIHLHLDLILGLPYDTEQTFYKSFNDVFALQPHHIQMGLLKVLPSTAISKANDFELIHCQAPPYEILANKWLNHGEMTRLYHFCECVEAFYNNRYFKRLFRYVLEKREDPAQFINALLEVCLANDFFARSHTQEFLSRILKKFAQTRADGELIIELLCYDWLRCGHKFLPGFLQNQSLPKIREIIWKNLPQNLPPLFTYKTRNEFLKQTIFHEFSKELIREVGLDGGFQDDIGYVAFLPEETRGVMKWRKTMVMDFKSVS